MLQITLNVLLLFLSGSYNKRDNAKPNLLGDVLIASHSYFVYPDITSNVLPLQHCFKQFTWNDVINLPLEEQLEEVTSSMEKEFKSKLLDRGLTIQALAKAIGSNRSSVSLAISGSNTPKAKILREKARKFLGMKNQ